MGPYNTETGNHYIYNHDYEFTTMVVDIMVPSHSVIRSHKKKIESSPSMIFPQGIETLRN
jgi:hypothetical protein